VSDAQRTQKIKELTQKLSIVKDKKAKLDTEANSWADKRDELNEQGKRIRNEIFTLRNERNRLNEQVKELKQQRETARTEIREKIEKIKKLSQEIKVVAEKRPSRGFQVLQKEVEAIDWKIQTTSLNVKEEKELVDQVKQLEAQLSIYRKLDKLRQARLNLQNEVKSLKEKSDLYHKNLTEIAQKSQETHEKLLKNVDESKRLKAEADGFHKLYLEIREKAKPLQEELLTVSNELRRLKGEIREEEQQEKRKGDEAIRGKLEKQAREKLERGEKLTWEEFQLLAKDEDEPQD